MSLSRGNSALCLLSVGAETSRGLRVVKYAPIHLAPTEWFTPSKVRSWLLHVLRHSLVPKPTTRRQSTDVQLFSPTTHN